MTNPNDATLTELASGETAATPPVQVDGNINQAGIMTILLQVLAALGVLISFMGLSEQLWIVKLYRFLQSEPAIPVLTLIATAAVPVVAWIRARRRSVKMAFMGAMLPNRFAQVRGTLHPTVQAAVEAATEQDLNAPRDVTRGL
jgi:hypothetical protein